MFKYCLAIFGGTDEEQVEDTAKDIPRVKDENTVINEELKEPELNDDDPVVENEAEDEEAKPSEVEAFMQKLQGGIQVIKFDRNLKGKQERILYSPDNEHLSWKRPSNGKASSKMFAIKEISEFRTSETQSPQTLSSVAKCHADKERAFQLVLPHRNVDLQANSAQEMNEIITGLKARQQQLIS
mmetsp:Transcript_7744/g.10310  ORF Transcript_7744/g.10310 Transcript_7744/m.10310 type:complete len:184 (+) Transcript_7744:92-643(+)|eukprot:CAMPEP_0117754992 /NCGR_PEP_ID=MMETSP0947-20121206/13179_1 /TAXON_ID=44440 /ORGANISM="Chattonella subsalsa, Strain CCMP2191" /LENGTH=183 /DNA_ID=CAMNT_0005574227 /DNA_START=326 /DNA_END=877 /DNA_ORIENTATION=-